MLKIRRSLRRLIFNMEIAIPGKTVFLIETAPRSHPSRIALNDDVIKWKHFPRFWPFAVRGIHRSPMNSSNKGQWRGALMFSLICAWISGSKQSLGWWFETPSRPLWRHCNDKSLSNMDPSPIASIAFIANWIVDWFGRNHAATDVIRT